MVKMTEEEIRQDERTKIWKKVNNMKPKGYLGRNRFDKNSERNGMILVANMIFADGINYVERDKDGKTN